MTLVREPLVILVLALSLYFLPLSHLLSSDSQRYTLLLYVAAQYLFVVSCYKITQQSWVSGVIIIEAVCMTFNLLLFVMWPDSNSVLYSIHGKFMAFAFALELLLIQISIGGMRGRKLSHFTRIPRHSLMCRVNNPFCVFGGKKDSRCEA